MSFAGRRPAIPPEMVLAQMVRWRSEHGRWPSWQEWKLSGPDHPSGNTVVRRFGSWPAAIVAAERELAAVRVRERAAEAEARGEECFREALALLATVEMEVRRTRLRLAGRRSA